MKYKKTLFILIITFILSFTLFTIFQNISNNKNCITTFIKNSASNKLDQNTVHKCSPLENSTANDKNLDSSENVNDTTPIHNEDNKLDGFTYIEGILIVNKTYSIPQTYNPGENSEARNAFNKMKSDAKNLGLNLYISSGFRSYSKQEQIYNRYLSKSNKEIVDSYSARPGHSEHQTGLAFDLNGLEGFEKTREYNWLKDNAHLYGFIIRYPEGKQSITGFKFEPWHIRYVGITLAEKLYHSKLCIEEYFNIDSKYK